VRTDSSYTEKPESRTVQTKRSPAALPNPGSATPRVLILYNEPVLAEDHPDADSEHEILYTVGELEKELSEAGVSHLRTGVLQDPTVLLQAVDQFKPDVVFNLYEGLATDPGSEAHMAGLLEWMNLPFTGSPALTLSLCRNKHLAKQLLLGSGLPTPAFQVVDSLPIPELRLDWPVIVKPSGQDASVGVDQGAVVTSLDQLEKRIAWVLENYGGPVLLEELILGREFSVGLVEMPELTPLPVSEIHFPDEPPEGFWPIVTYDAKWKPGSSDYELTPPDYPANISETLRERLYEIAISAFRAVGCRDYARVDFRVDENDQPFILEVNPNPDFSPVAGLAGCMDYIGVSHKDFALILVRQALARAARARALAG
jgi:D-alanine-D-alanine ligase